MKINRGKVARFHYTLKDETGEILETTQGSEPMAYLHGYRNIIDSLEEVLEGRSSGDKYTAVIEAGNRGGETADTTNSSAVKKISIDIEILEVRDALPVETAHGHAHGVGGHHH